MTEPTEATADREPEVNREIIEDLDPADEDADLIRGGCAGGVSYICLPQNTYIHETL